MMAVAPFFPVMSILGWGGMYPFFPYSSHVQEISLKKKKKLVLGISRYPLGLVRGAPCFLRGL